MPLLTFEILPCLPKRLARLEELAYNLWWSWDHEAISLFRRLDPDLWEATGHNPVRLLGEIAQEKLTAAAGDEGFLAHLDQVLQTFDRYMQRTSWFQKNCAGSTCDIAYFAAEFAISECLPLYSGGLAVLAGDHLKSASDLGLPLTGVSLLYRQGYFQQYLNEAGWQQETYVDNDFHALPLHLEQDASGHPLEVEVAYPAGPVRAQIWRIQVGRVPLFMLDTDLEENRPEDRQITAHLYGGGAEMRIRQEILLGIGGVRALQLLGRQPTVCHMNEGHSAFLALERIRLLMEQEKISFPEAREAVAASTVFTTHTPVPAGIDVFSPDLMARYFSAYAGRLGLSWEEFLGLGKDHPDANFSMAVLALKLAQRNNAVSQLHGQVARRLWKDLWPGVPADEIPIVSITNGVHIQSWISGDMAELFDRYLGPRWRQEPGDLSIWKEIADIPDSELWRTHERQRERLLTFIRERLKQQLRNRGAPLREIGLADEILDPEALTIGFGRRFATYKRAALLLRDQDRLERLLCNPEHPVQLVVAGKAHPRDDAGKNLIRQLAQLARQESFRPHLIFLENYDLDVARALVQGVDLWLNTPRRPHEACGTSGMKAMANGVINISTLDGWWAEGYEIDLGWSIGCGEEYADQDYQDQVEAQALYEILEKEVVPLFYARERDNLPRAWIGRMKSSMSRLCPRFNANRMVREYVEHFYLAADRQWMRYVAQGAEKARKLAAWKCHLRAHWGQISVEQVEEKRESVLRVGQQVEIQALIHLGGIAPHDVLVELYYGPLDSNRQISRGQCAAMEWQKDLHDGRHLFVGAVPCRTSGLYGGRLRIRPGRQDEADIWEPGLFFWD